MTSGPRRVAVVGGGISGLAAAFRLQQAGCAVTLLEADARLGGKIFSERAHGFLVEHGPNGVLDSRPGFLALAADLGLTNRLLPARDAAAHRYLFLRGRLQELPTSPGRFVGSDLLSVAGRMRLLAEPLVPGRRQGPDETVFDFAARRVGPEAARTLIDPLVTGIYGGDAQRTSLPAAFPRLRDLEDRHGSLVRGMVARMVGAASGRLRARLPGGAGAGAAKKAGGPSGPGGTLTCFPNGLSELVEALRARLGPAVHSGRPVRALERLPAGAGATWRLVADGGAAVEADAVVLALPTDGAAALLAPHLPAAAEALAAVPYAAVGVVAYGLRAADLPRTLDGFGYLVPSSERRRVLGVLWTSSIFAERAPDGHALLRVILGGSSHPELLDLSDAELLAVVKSELEVTLGGPLPPPVFHRIVRWPRAIPQYTLGHRARRDAAEAAVASLPGLHLAGNGLFGVSVAECIDRGSALVPQVLAS